MNAHVLVTHDSRQTVACVTGELDIATALRIRLALLDAIHRHERVVDQPHFCDCAGLSALITAQKTADAHGTALAIRNTPAQLARLLHCIPHPLPITPREPGGMPTRWPRAELG
ncbi:STAS domain-containing protein [Streptomyces sp. NPDC053431]|uniref:STAS domain-containing protein n=1 Tax=Streptomyces sp. NPDC053431 TaxID=3365703 RepID=UPI0037D3CD1B